MIRLAAWMLALALLLAPMVALLNGWLAAERWPIRRLLVHAEFQHVEDEAVRAAAQPYLVNGFFAVDLDQVRHAVTALPWVETVEVRKHWPDVVELTVVEHRAFARWGADRLLSERGVLFVAPLDQVEGLPELDGPDSRIQEVLQMFLDSRAVFARHRIVANTLRLSPRGSWSLVLSDGARVMAGRGDPLPRLERFAAALPRLAAVDKRRLERADLRYSNGFSLRWQDPAPGIPADGSKA